MRWRTWLPSIVVVGLGLLARHLCKYANEASLSEALWLHPEGIVALLPGLVSEKECAALAVLATDAGFAASTVIEETQTVSDARHAKTAFVLTGYWKSRTHASVAARIVRHFALLPSEARRIAAGGSALTDAHLEDLQSTQYGAGGAYRQHVDGDGAEHCMSSAERCAGDDAMQGCRMHTALLYCTTNPSEGGGATSFLFHDNTSVRVLPQLGSVVMFPADVWHASERLHHGEKQIFNFWALCKPESWWSYYAKGAVDRLVDAVGRQQLEAWLDVDLVPFRKSDKSFFF
jgi:hypothetical protein